MVTLWAYPILLAGVALGADAAYERIQYGLLSAGALDEVAHLTTAALGLLVLACFIELPLVLYPRLSSRPSPSTWITSPSTSGCWATRPAVRSRIRLPPWSSSPAPPSSAVGIEPF